jgi:hypothetical protein
MNTLRKDPRLARRGQQLASWLPPVSGRRLKTTRCSATAVDKASSPKGCGPRWVRLRRKQICRIILLALAGCATTAVVAGPPSPVPPPPVPVSLELVGTHPAARVVLHTVIAPGQTHPFPPTACWCDEYALTISNQSPTVLTVESATVIDLHNDLRHSGYDLNTLAARSRDDWRAYQKAGVPVSPKMPTLDGLKFVVFAPFAAELVLAPSTCPYGFVLTPFLYGEAVREAVKTRRDFAARQLKLPLRLEPGQSAKGSLSFPMTPGPSRFVLQGQSNGNPVEIFIPLNGLSTLHLTAMRTVLPPGTGTRRD